MRRRKKFLLIILFCILLALGSDSQPLHKVDIYDRYQSFLDSAKTQEGVFKIHQVEDSWYMEIPKELLGRDFYWYTELSKAPAVFISGLGMIEEKMVSFERKDDNLLVLERSTVQYKRAGPEPESAENLSVAQSALPAVLFSLPIFMESPSGSLLIEVGELFSKDVPGFSLGAHFGARSDPNRSYLERLDAYPNNIGISTLLTFSFSDPLEEALIYNMSVSALVRHNITLLPEKPARGRYADPRVGYFTSFYEDYSGERDPDMVTRALITRFHLEKKDPKAKLSEPVTPIVFYISREVPERWRPYIKQGVEDWQVAFEAAGFKNAILARDAPSPEKDPAWDPSDTRYSVIRWVAQPVANAMGPSTVDPRSGEILSSHVQIFADILDQAEQWYFTQASAADPRARKLPLPEEILGEALRYITAHEVGHGLGLRHNHRASQVFSVEQLRDPEFTAQYGTSPSIMSYGRFNYIAQPGDGVTHFMPKIGPYDIFAIEWGYRPLPNTRSAEDEFLALDTWAARQLKDPYLLYGGEDLAAYFDPNVLSENLGAERVEATRLGIQNLERLMPGLIAATARTGKDYAKLDQTYRTILETRQNWLLAVVKQIGGVEELRTLAGRGDVQFKRVPKQKQQEALRFVMKNLRTPRAFALPAILDRITPAYGLNLLQDYQSALLGQLLEPERYLRLVEGELLDPEDAYPLAEYLADIQARLFEELRAATPQIDISRRMLQRQFLATLQAQTYDSESNSDLRIIIGVNMQTLLEDIEAAKERAVDQETSLHLADIHRTVQMMALPQEQTSEEDQAVVPTPQSDDREK